MKIEVCILAGGKSSRMGRSKAKMLLDGSPLLDWARRIALGAGLPYRVIDQDVVESRGPISGIVTALKSTRAEAVIFLSCDMPFVRSATLRELGKMGAPAFCVSEGLAGFPFILAKRSAVETEALQELARKLKAGVLEIDAEEAFNINTPADFAKAEQMLKIFARERILDVDSLTMRRGEVAILRDVNWRVNRGEHWTILGANGSGKTSLLSALTGYVSPTAGRMRLLGQEFGRADWRELRTHVGLVSSALRQLMADGETALETVASGKDAVIDVWGPLKRADAAQARRILAEIGCSYLEKRVWAVLSQGERQRVLIGRALMANPRALILDEPCAGLDPAAREHFLEFLQALTEKRSGPAIILVTHHVEEIVEGITHVLALKNGDVVAAGPKEQALTSELLSDIFECNAKLRREDGRYALRVTSKRGGVM